MIMQKGDGTMGRNHRMLAMRWGGTASVVAAEGACGNNAIAAEGACDHDVIAAEGACDDNLWLQLRAHVIIM